MMHDRLRELLKTILPTNRFYAAKFAGLDPLRITMPELPFTTKAELLADQQSHPPYGSALTYPVARYSRMHQTSGTTTGQPLRWLDTPESWNAMLDLWREMFARIGLRRDDRLFFPFSFGPFLGFWTAFESAVRDGSFVVPGGGMSSLARLRFLLDHKTTVVFCTPTYALHLAEVAAREGIEIAASPVRPINVAGEPGGGITETRRRIEAAWGARVVDHSGMTEIGPCAIESANHPGGLRVVESGYVAEVIEPTTAAPVAARAIGELVLTNLFRVGSPLVRYRTGDLVRAEPGPDGQAWFPGGILGRADDMIHLRGNNIYPGAIEAIIRRFTEVAEFRLIVDRRGSLPNLRVEVECVPSASESIVVDRIGKALRDELLFRADVAAVAAGALPRFEMKAQRLVWRK